MGKFRQRVSSVRVPGKRVYQIIRDENGEPKVFKHIGDRDTVNVRQAAIDTGRPPEFVTLPYNVSPEKKLQELIAKEAREKILVGQEMQRQGQAEIALLDKAVAPLDDMVKTWGFGIHEVDPTARINLQKNEHSSLHRLNDAFQLGEVVNTHDDPPGTLKEGELVNLMQGELNPDLKTFLVCHDWFKVLGDAEGEFKLPFENCAFEFKAEGRYFIALVSQAEGSDPTGAGYYESGRGEWLRMKLEKSWWDQIKATCVMLDAQVATHSVHRIPHKMNAKRAKAGKGPMYDFHIVDLARRHKSCATPGPGQATGRHVRLHFVRGHWRHYETHKTWVKWHLRGDPDLGYIDKDYRL